MRAALRTGKPVFEVIQPGSRAACAASAGGHIGVIATQGTVNSGIYGRTLRALGARAVEEQACPAFVPLVERGIADGPEVEAALAEYLTPLRASGIDTLIFGCTHYPFLREPIARFLGPTVQLIDPAEFVAREVAALSAPVTAPAAAPPSTASSAAATPAACAVKANGFSACPSFMSNGWMCR